MQATGACYTPGELAGIKRLSDEYAGMLNQANGRDCFHPNQERPSRQEEVTRNLMSFFAIAKAETEKRKARKRGR
jgi:hypothetical protein